MPFVLLPRRCFPPVPAPPWPDNPSAFISRISLGTLVLGGMIVATFLSLYVVPVFYAIATNAQHRLMEKMRSHTSSNAEPDKATES